jgi:O-acetylhomoserine/O-acetylserine sulfhydrylase-like pyridoxal-dependent enzyme
VNDDTDGTSARTARGFSTRAIKAASRVPRLDQVPTSVPIFQTATFTSPDAEALGDVLGDPRGGYAYSRIGNPTTAALGAAYAELAGGELGAALASGMGAIHAAIASRVRSGDRIVASRDLYGSTRSLLLNTFGGFGVEVDLVDITDLDAVGTALAVRPAAILYAESIANPTTVVADHARLAELAHRHGASYVVDNTFASP